MDAVFFELSAIVIISTACALVARLLKQPIILAFIIAGILLGPLGFNVIQSHGLINVLSNIGLALMLYVVAVELDWRKFKSIDRPTLLTGFGQILFTGFVGWLTSILLGFSLTEAWFIALTLTLSSTIIIVKILGQKGQLESLYGRITISILLLQDIVAIIALLLIESMNGAATLSQFPWASLLAMVVKAIGLGLLAYLLARYVFRRIFLFVGQSQDLLFLWSIAWCLLFAVLAGLIQFPVAISVYFAGLAIGSMDYNFEIAARIRTLRDFFIVIFFTYLGSQLFLTMPLNLVWSAVILSLFVIIGNPLIVYIILRLLGHQQRTALFAGLTMGQISEFSFILAQTGFRQGLIDQPIVAMIAIVGLISIMISAYTMSHNEKVYRILKPVLERLPLPKPRLILSSEIPHTLKNHIILFGYYPTVNKVLRHLKRSGETIVVVDYNPENISAVKAQGIYTIYGDMRDEEILHRASISTAKMVISLIPYHEANVSLLQFIRHFNIRVDVIVVGHYLEEIRALYESGATLVLSPESISLEYLQSVLLPKQLVKASQLHRKEIFSLVKQQTYHHLP